ncbi:hypothetical protein CPB84DRAFT_278960 [Gymnopilus junonius]|uniref:Uncharacterized protein n=1 Tax=Gymnopilus junonius TaxID=109634 RepID=A0A9P5ND19_GYMJU|nr:hypothetical protein CPB84DRAFT_278960 [Gymnopilus junonius]
MISHFFCHLGTLLLHLFRNGATEHAHIKYRSSYEEALEVIYEVFGSIRKQDIELRRRITSEKKEEPQYAKFLPREWADIIERPFDEIGIFLLKENSKQNKKTEEMPELMHMHLSDRQPNTKAEENRFLIPIPASYELCQEAALALLEPYERTASHAILMGLFPGPRNQLLLSTLTPGSYGPYVATTRPLEITVSWKPPQISNFW